MEETISLGEIFGILKKRLVLIIFSFLIGVAVAAGVTFFLITPKYSSSAELIVQSKNDSSNANLQADVNANVLLINTYKDMIMGDVVLNDVQDQLAKEMDYDLSKAELKEIVSVVQSQNSQMFQIKATSDNPDKASDIANVTADIFKEKATDVLDVNKVTITSQAQVNPSPVSPNNKLNVAIGAVLGLMIGIGLAFLLELLDKTVKDERIITEELELPIMGVISEISSKELSKGLKLDLAPKIDVSQPTQTTVTEESNEEMPSRRSRTRV